jgi:mycoredoxin
MKKTLLILAALALWQRWDRLERRLKPPQAGNAGGEIVLYATSWCGYCVKTRARH